MSSSSTTTSSSSSSSSRLDRLFTLLSTSSSAATRSLAAQQLGQVQKHHPAELPVLLTHLHPLLRSNNWDSRLAGVQALQAVLKELAPWDPPAGAKKEEEEELKSEYDDNAPTPASLATFDLSSVLSDEVSPLTASQGAEFEAVNQTDLEEQKAELNRQMGAGFTAHISNDDLQPGSPAAAASPGGSGSGGDEEMSARQRNRLKRALSKQLHHQTASQRAAKRAKSDPVAGSILYQVGRDQLDPLSWPLGDFCRCLLRDLFDDAWEVRHGAATALREVARLQGQGAGRVAERPAQKQAADHRAWLEDVALKLISVIARDRFGDFVSDQVVAPVRESSAQALGSVLTVMEDEEDIRRVAKILLQFLKQENWQCRHGGLLGIKYLLAVRSHDLAPKLLTDLYPSIFGGLQDEVDDVAGVAAASLVPVVHHLINNQAVQIEQLSNRLWDSLKVLDDLTSSSHSIMQLLSEIIKFQSWQELGGGHDLITKVPLLFPFLSHTSSLVRKATLSALDTLTSKQEVCHVFLPHVVKDLCLNLFQRALIEHQSYNLELIERIWSNACDYTPLGPLLMATCPLYGTWVSMILLPPGWPLPAAAMLAPKLGGNTSVSTHYLGGPDVQHLVDPAEKSRYEMRARHLGAKLLGKLAGFIVQPVPGMDYSQDVLPPLDMFVSKILLPNLNTRFAYQRTAVSMIISEWSEQHNIGQVPAVLREQLISFLMESPQPSFEETRQAFTQLQTETMDFASTLKHYKLPLPPCVTNNAAPFTFEQIKAVLKDTDLCRATSPTAGAKTKLKPKVLNSLVERQNGLMVSLKQLVHEQMLLVTMTLASNACAAVGLREIPEKLNPVIKPLMESVKKERSELLQKLSALKLAKVLEICVEQSNQAPVEKVIKNLVNFVSADTSRTPAFTRDQADNACILLLKTREAAAKAAKAVSGKGRRGREAVKEAKEAVEAAGEAAVSGEVNTGDANQKVAEDAAEKSRVQSRGAQIALETIVKHFHSDVFERLPRIYELTLGAILHVGRSDGDENVAAATVPTANEQLVLCLHAFEVIVPVLSSSLHLRLEAALPFLVSGPLLQSDFASIRHLSARCLAELSRILPLAVMICVINHVIPLFDSETVSHRQGAIECVAFLVERLEVDIIPYIVLLIVPVLGRMSDLDEHTRLLATNTFATLIKLIPLDGSGLASEPVNLPKEIVLRKADEKKFMDQLTNVKNLEDYPLPIKVEAELRSYQKEGIKWLAFLNRYKLHGILCDDMGLGKTLQTICMLAGDHFNLQMKVEEKEMKSSSPATTSLVICPPTLCGHWKSEVVKFVGSSRCLRPLVYAGPLATRLELRHTVPNHNLVISSYDVVRNDLDFFSTLNWHYVVLDEGHIIKNGRTKTTLAIKSLRSRHRLILSGTPIQNSVLELWSLFDFLMPGFLGTERHFASKYSRPIVNSRDPRCSTKDQEAGALAMEALHRQVLPFVLRRMKGDVLQDLPPKITQDYYCDLSPLQIKLYEEFTRAQQQKAAAAAAAGTNTTANLSGSGSGPPPAKIHIFQTLQHLRKVCNHPKLVMDPAAYQDLTSIRSSQATDDIQLACKLPALRDLLLQCGIGDTSSSLASAAAESLAVQHRALIFFQFKSMIDIVEHDLLNRLMPSVTYLRLDGSVPAASRHDIVDKFNKDISIDVLLLSTSVGGLGLNLTGADTVIFVEHDWNPMKDLQAMDRAHRIGQKKVVNVYRLITRNTIEEKILGLQQFKLKTANTVISSDNASLQSMATDQIFDLFSLDDEGDGASGKKGVKRRNSTEAASRGEAGGGGGEDDKKGFRALLEDLPDLWDEKEYEEEYDINAYMSKNATAASTPPAAAAGGTK